VNSSKTIAIRWVRLKTKVNAPSWRTKRKML